MQKNINNTIDSLIKQYSSWATFISNNPNNTMGFYLKTSICSIYVRNMARGIISKKHVFSLSSINIEEDYQNLGILTELINYIEKNPFLFKEIEVENILTERLLHYFIKLNYTPLSNELDRTLPVTVSKII